MNNWKGMHMVRSLTSLALATAAVLAMSAVVASAVSAASQYTGSSYPTTMTGANLAGKETFTTAGGTWQCSRHYEGSLNAASSTMTVSAKVSECVAFGFLNATVAFNGCDYLLHAGASLGAGNYKNSLDIVCPAGSGPITITGGTCKVDIPAQTGLSYVETTNLAGGTITAQLKLTNITLNVTTDGFGCPFPGTGHSIGAFHGDVVLSRVGGGSISLSGS